MSSLGFWNPRGWVQVCMGGLEPVWARDAEGGGSDALAWRRASEIIIIIIGPHATSQTPECVLLQVRLRSVCCCKPLGKNRHAAKEARQAVKEEAHDGGHALLYFQRLRSAT
eukprot:521356-Rhodomonas_salina.2